jgi:hypothetical protein
MTPSEAQHYTDVVAAEEEEEVVVVSDSDLSMITQSMAVGLVLLHLCCHLVLTSTSSHH